MKTFVWPTGSQNTRSTAFDWNNLDYNSRTSNKEKAIDPKVQECVEYGKSTLPSTIYQIKMTSGLNDREIIVLLKAVVSAVRPIAEAGMTNRLNNIIEQTTGYRIANDQFNLSDKQMVQAADLMIEFLNSKL